MIYEDNHLLVVEKPVNVPVQADRSYDPDLLTHLKDYLKIKYDKPGKVYLGLVHRLDRPVGGVIVFARTSKAASRLSDQLRRQVFDRQYLAVVRGHLSKTQNWVELVDYLIKDSHRNQSYVVDKNQPGAKKAILRYQVLAQQLDSNKQPISLLKVQLLTGRSHQIRLQLAHLGFPLWGDQKYGSKQNRPGQQVALWAYHLGIEHPTQKDWRTYHSIPRSGIWEQFANELSQILC